MPKPSEHTEETREGRQEVQRLMSTVVGNMDGVSDEQRQRAQELLGKGGTFLDRVDSIEVANLSVYDMVGGAYNVATVVAQGGSASEVGGAVLENTVGTAIDNFLKEHATYEGELFSFDEQISTPVFTGVNADIGFNAEITTELNVRRDGASLTGTAGLHALARLRVGISFGFNAPGLGELSVGGGLQGGPNIDAEASITLSLAGANLTGSLNPTTFGVALAAELYFSVPSVIPDDVTKWVAEALGLTSSGNRILYPLGTLDVITATTPGYTVTFNMRSGSFTNASATGQWSFELNQRIKDFVQNLKDALVQGFDEIRRRAEEAIGDIVEGAQEIASDVVDAVSDAADAVSDTAEEVVETATRVVRATRRAVQHVAETTSQAAEAVVETGRQAVDAVVEAGREIAERGRQAVEELSERGREALDTVQSAVSEVYDTGRELASDVGDAISDGASSLANGASAVADALWPW
jgi:hypothetical protein